MKKADITQRDYLQKCKLARKVYDDISSDFVDWIESAIEIDRVDINGDFAGFRIYSNYSMARVTVDTEQNTILCRGLGYDDDIWGIDGELSDKINNYLYMGD